MTQTVTQTLADWCVQSQTTFEQLVERSGLEETRVKAILLRRWTPSPFERERLAAVFGIAPDQVVWGHATPIQHIYGL